MKKQNKLTPMEKYRKWKHFEKFRIAMMVILIVYAFVVWMLIWFDKSNKYLVYSVVPICFVFSFLMGNDFFILLGQLATICADTCMQLFSGNIQIIGICFFMVTQFIYAAYFFIKDKSKIRRIVLTITRAVLMIVLPLIVRFVIAKSNDVFMILSAIYIPNLLINVIAAGFAKTWILFAGLLVFFCSDVVIGLNKLLDSKSPFVEFSLKYNLIHLLYIPSQVIISLNRDRLDLKVNRYI